MYIHDYYILLCVHKRRAVSCVYTPRVADNKNTVIINDVGGEYIAYVVRVCVYVCIV